MEGGVAGVGHATTLLVASIFDLSKRVLLAAILARCSPPPTPPLPPPPPPPPPPPLCLACAGALMCR
jgi:hypothetical protein